MAGSDFDIYQTDDGYIAVTNDVRRAILAALAKKDRQLPELVDLTRKAKPTLSSLHMRELLATRLVEEIPHPTDGRKKIYRLRARHIGTSDLPLDQLRGAVERHAGATPPRALALALDAIAAAPANAPAPTLRAQARRVGELCAPDLTARDGRELVTTLAALFEREGVARPLRLDLESLSLELEVEHGKDVARYAILIAGVAEGCIAQRAGDADGSAVSTTSTGPRRFCLALPSATLSA